MKEREGVACGTANRSAGPKAFGTRTELTSAPAFDFTVVPKARHNHPMTVRGFATAHGRTVEHGHLDGFSPAVVLEAKRQLADVLVGAAAERLLDGARDVSDVGLAQVLVEGVLRYGTGARVALPFDIDPFEALFSESAARPVVAVWAGAELRVRELCEATGVPYTAIGTTGGDALRVGDLFDVRLDELRAVHEATLPVALER
jgi:phosphoribosylformylglycinamidine synthase subunit PurL